MKEIICFTAEIESEYHGISIDDLIDNYKRERQLKIILSNVFHVDTDKVIIRDCKINTWI